MLTHNPSTLVPVLGLVLVLLLLLQLLRILSPLLLLLLRLTQSVSSWLCNSSVAVKKGGWKFRGEHSAV